MNIENMNNKNVKSIRSQNNIVLNVIHRSGKYVRTLVMRNMKEE